MEQFKISDIQEIFVSDVERFHKLTQHHVSQLLNETPPPPESLDEALRQCHTLKGLAGTVQAWGLACLGADLERLLELAGSWMDNEREKANGIFEFILDHMQDWYVMNQFTCMDMLPQAWDVYQGLRGIMVERWPGSLPPPASADGENAHYVRLTDLEIPDLPVAVQMADTTDQATPIEQPTPELDVEGAQPIASLPEPAAPTPLRVVPPTLRQRTEPAAPAAPGNTDVQQSEPIAHLEQPAAPKPLRVVPPTLRHRDQTAAPTPVENLEVSPSSPAPPTSEPVAHAEQPAAPKPLQVIPPSLRRRKGAHHGESEPAQSVHTEGVATPGSDSLATAQPMAVPTAQTETPPVAVRPPVAATPVVPAQKVAAEHQTAESSSSTTPPILRVAPPALKRRAKKVEPTAVPGLEVEATQKTQTPVEHVPVMPLAVESTAIVPASVEPAKSEALSAEDIFAALPPSAETSSVEAAAASPAIDQLSGGEKPGLETSRTAPIAETKSAEEFKRGTAAQEPGDVSEFLEMLSQEVAGYLADLTTSLTALAANLADGTQWEQTRRLFHTIKGTAATFNLDAVSTPAKAAEACCLLAIEAAQRQAPNLSDNREAFETCLHRAHVVAKALHLPFDEQPLREALETGLAQSANHAAATAVPEVAPLDPEMAGFFINDTRDQIEIIEQAVLRWEKGQKPGEQVNAAQRGFHTIKGAGNSIGLTAVAQSVHEVEAFLEGVAAAGAVGSKPLFTFLLGAVDQLRHYLAELTKNTASPWRHDWKAAIQLFQQPAKAGATSAPAARTPVVQAALPVEQSEDDGHTLRVESARLYEVMNLIGEMVIDRARLARKIEQLTALHRALAERNGALTGSVQTFQQQFEFNLFQAKGRGRQDGNGRLTTPHQSSEDGTASPSSILHPQSSSSAGPGHEFSELEFDRYDQFNVLARSLVEISHDIEQLNGEVAACLESFSAENAQFKETSQQLQSKVTSLSLVPVNTLFPRLQRAFRDALNVEHKEADLELSGGEALLDKVVVDKVYAPLLHLLRNAAAHGIEDAIQREKMKKPARGQVRLSALPLANQIVIQIADDGAGVDEVAVRQRAVAKGWLAADAPALTPEQVVHFIFQPGFSTAARVTSVSGRGIGLDVVRKEIENLNGSVELKYAARQGSTWTLRLPLTLSISEAILANVGTTTFAFPLNFIESGLILDAPTTRAENGQELFAVPEVALARGEQELGVRSEESKAENLGVRSEESEAGTPNSQLLAPSSSASSSAEALPVVRLSRLFHLPGDPASDKGLIVSVGDRRAIVVVDVVFARQEIVIKQLDSVMTLHPLLNGATLDPEGRVIPILNLPVLLKWAEQEFDTRGQGKNLETRSQKLESPSSNSQLLSPNSSAGVRPSALRVLVVDDSLSVRKVQERYLAEVGCQVTTAADGLFALERMREQEFDFIFTDLEMPRLNGYEFISELQGNPAWASIPIVVVSSRGADKYITKAMNLGATTFLAKPFTQEQLLQVLKHYAKAGNVGRSSSAAVA